MFCCSSGPLRESELMEEEVREEIIKPKPGTSVPSPASAGSTEEGWRVPQCAICLETSNPSVKVMLSCGHVFCWSCISQYVLKLREESRLASCPQCKKPLQKHELAICLSSEAAEQLIADDAARVPVSDCQQSSDCNQESSSGVRAVPHLKRCPSCQALIQKNGGCDHMTCRCGREFFWSQVPCATPCNCVNPHPKFPIWGQTCPNCAWTATGKLAARRAGIIVVGVLSLPVVVVGGAVVIVGAGVYNAGAAARARFPESEA